MIKREMLKGQKPKGIECASFLMRQGGNLENMGNLALER